MEVYNLNDSSEREIQKYYQLHLNYYQLGIILKRKCILDFVVKNLIKT